LRILRIISLDLDVYGDMESQFENGGMGVWWGVLYGERNVLKRVFSRTLGTILGTILICNSLIGCIYSIYISSTVELTSTNSLFNPILNCPK